MSGGPRGSSPSAASPRTRQGFPGSVTDKHKAFARAIKLHLTIDELLRELFADVDAGASGTNVSESFDFAVWLLSWIRKQPRRTSVAGRRSSVNHRFLIDQVRTSCDRLWQEDKGAYAQRMVECSLNAVTGSLPQQVPAEAHLRELQIVIEEKLRKEKSGAEPHGVGELLRVAAEKSKFDASEDGQRVEGAPQPLDFYPRDYNPLKAPLRVVREMGDWNDPKGRLWPQYAINALTENCKRMIAQHSGGEPREVVVPLFTYSAFFFHKKIWAVWLPFRGGGKWYSLPGKDGPADFVACIEKDYNEAITGAVMKLDRATHTKLNAIVELGRPKEPQERESDGKIYSDFIRFPAELQRVVREGQPADERGEPNAMHCWAGLDLWCGENRFKPPDSALSARRDSAQHLQRQSGKGDDIVVAEPFVYLARYCLPVKQVGSVQHPLHDAVGWLPMPAAGGMFLFQPAKESGQAAEGADGADKEVPFPDSGLHSPDPVQSPWSSPESPRDYHAHKGTSFVRPRWGRAGQGGDPQKVPRPQLAPFDCFPPPGVLEYVFSKRSHEQLTLTSESASTKECGQQAHKCFEHITYTVRPVVLNETCMKLRQDCIDQKNQAKYDEDLHNRMKGILIEYQESEDTQQPCVDSTARGAVKDPRFKDSAVLESVYRMKTGDDIQYPDPLVQPSALSIAHSLDIQRVVRTASPKEGEPGNSSGEQHCEWAVAFSGKPYAIYGDFGDSGAEGKTAPPPKRCLPWFRMHRHFEDQPFWHLNAAMRCLQLSGAGTSVTVSQDAKKKTIHKFLEGDYTDTRDPAAIGAGLRAMAASFDLDDDSARSKSSWWQALGRMLLRVGFTKTVENAFGQKAWYTIQWHDPEAEAWFREKYGSGQSSADSSPDQPGDEATAGYLVPYKYTWRNADSPRASAKGGKEAEEGDTEPIQEQAHWCLRGTFPLYLPHDEPHQRAQRKSVRFQKAGAAAEHGDTQQGAAGPASVPAAGGQQQQDASQQADAQGAGQAAARTDGKADGKLADSKKIPEDPGYYARFTGRKGEPQCWLSLGTWLLHQCRPLIWQIAKALHSLSPVVNKMQVKPDSLKRFYRGLKGVKLNAKVYAQGNMLLWGQFSSTSTDQGVAQSFAEGSSASIFTLQGLKCCLIAPWSRFGREEEWLFAPNSLWLVKSMLTEEQQQILVKNDIQVYEMDEVVSETQMDHIQIRYSLSKADTVASASVIFQAETAIESGGFLNLSLDGQADDGSAKDSWIYAVRVTYDGWHQCPLQTSTQWLTCDKAAAEGLFKVMVAGETQSITGDDTAPEKQQKWAINVERGIYKRDKRDGSGDPISCAVLDNLDKILHVRAEEVCLGYVPPHRSSFEVKVYDSRWNALLTIRKHGGRPTSAIEDAGAELLAEILARGVRLKYVDVRNNNITQKGTRALLDGIRRNPHVRACDLGTVQSKGKAAAKGQDGQLERPQSTNGHMGLSQDEEARAINIRCLHNQGRITADKMEAFGPRWVEMAAHALYDCETISLDFAGLFEMDKRQATDRTVVFIQLVFAYRSFHFDVCDTEHPERAGGKEAEARAQARKRVLEKGFSLKGALVAACTFASPEQVQKLLITEAQENTKTKRKAMDPRETDQFGESPVLKARRRRDRALLSAGFRLNGEMQSAPCVARQHDTEVQLWSALIVEKLAVAKSEEVRPDLARYQPDVDPDEEYWRLKNFALLAVRMWEEKMRGGQDIADELGGGLRRHYPTAGGELEVRKLAEVLRRSVLHKSWGKHSAFTKTPHERVLVSLLCHALFVYSDKQWEERIGNALEGTPASGTTAAPGTDSSASTSVGKIPTQLRTACLALYDPQVWGTAETPEQHRRTLREWVLSWAMINCIIADTEEHIVPGETPLVKCIGNIPASAFAKWVTLRKGNSLAMAFGALWQCAQKEQDSPPPKGADAKAEHAGDRQFERLESAIAFSISGRCQGVAVDELFEGPQKDKEAHMLLPSLMYNLVGDTDAKKRVIGVQLVTRGSLLASDAELVAWRDTVLYSAVESEWGMVQPEEIAMSIPRKIKEASCMYPSSTTGTEQTPRAPDAGDKAVPIFLSHRLNLTDLQVQRAKQQRLLDRLKDCNEWKRMVIRNEQGWEWHFGSVDKRHALPYMMRPACTLLDQLQRDRERRESSLSAWHRAVQLRKPLLDMNPKDEVIVDQSTIEKYCKKCRQSKPPEVDTDLAQAADMQGEEHAEAAPAAAEEPALPAPGDTPRAGTAAHRQDEGAAAERRNTAAESPLSEPTGIEGKQPRLAELRPWHVFGRKQFRITVGELQQLVRSTLLTPVRSLPRIFFQVLCRRFTLNPLHMGEIRRNPFIPLDELCEAVPERKRDKVLGRPCSPACPKDKDATETEVSQAVRDAESKLLDQKSTQAPKGIARASAQDTKAALKEFYDEVIGSHAWYGFESEAAARCLLAQSVAQLGNALCVSQKGYLMTDGNEENVYNQICEKSDSPIVFLCAGAIDFHDPSSARVEFDRYLDKKHMEFAQNGDMALYQRIRAQYECIFRAARRQGVRNPSMLALGCGRALALLQDKSEVRKKIVEMYFDAQFELLSSEDWGFETYYINAHEHRDAIVRLRAQVQKNGACNSTADGRWLRCNIVFHEKDAKFVAQSLAKSGESPGLLIPTSTEALLFGQCGRTWEIGRTEEYFWTDQDWAATSTGVLGSYSICGPALGLDDIVLQLQSGNSLRLSVSEGRLLCAEQHGEVRATTLGPFQHVAYDPQTRELRVDTREADRDDPLLAARASSKVKTVRVWKVARVQHRVLLRELDRILQLKAGDGKDRGISVKVPTQVRELEEGRIHTADPDSSLYLRGIKLSDDKEVRNQLALCGVQETDIKWLTRTKGLPDGVADKDKDGTGETHCFLVEFATLGALLKAMARLPLHICDTFYDGEAPLGVEGSANKQSGLLSRYTRGIVMQRDLVGTVQHFHHYAIRRHLTERFPTLSAGRTALLPQKKQRSVIRYPQELSRDTRVPCTLRPAWTLLRLLGLTEEVKRQLEHPFPFSWDEIQSEVMPALDQLTKRKIPWDRESKQGSWPYNEAISRIRWPAYRNPRIALAAPIECLAADKIIKLDAEEMDETVRQLPRDIWYEEQCEAEAELLKGNGKIDDATRRGFYERHEADQAGVTTVTMTADRQQVACAKTLFGPKAFEISIADVCRLVQSATLITSGDCADAAGGAAMPRTRVPHDFLIALIGRFVHNEEFGPFFQGQRFRELNKLLLESHVQTRREQAEIQAGGVASVYKDLEGSRKAAGGWSKHPGHFMSEHTHYWNAEEGQEVKGTGKLQKLTLNKMKVVHACQRLNFTLDTEYHTKCVVAFRGFKELVVGNPSWLGFEDREHAERVLDKALIDYSTETCLAAQGYFMVGGNTKEGKDTSEERKSEAGGMNQLHEMTPAPITFLSTAAIDFGTSASTKNQAPLYFKKHHKAKQGDASGWATWTEGNPDGKQLLEARVRTFYTVLFTAAQKHRVNTPCMLPIGLGVFLGNLKEPGNWYWKDKETGKSHLKAGFTEEHVKECQVLKKEIVEIYWKVQFALLCEEDWGFDTYYINPREFLDIACKNLDERAADLRCNVVLHNRDVKFLAVALTYANVWGEPRRVSFLNPSDTCAVIGGDMGMYWALGRGEDYVGEEDFAATSTGCLLDYSIAGRALGLEDVHLLLRRAEPGAEPGRECAAARLRWALQGRELVYEFRMRDGKSDGDAAGHCGAKAAAIYSEFQLEEQAGVLILKRRLDGGVDKEQEQRWALQGAGGLVEDQMRCLRALQESAKAICDEHLK